MSEKKTPARREIKVDVGFPPVVTLLPPEVGQRKAAARARGRAIFIALIALGAAVVIAAAANLYSWQRALALETARSQTLSLIAQQGEYNDVRIANQQLQSAEAARIFASSTEISVSDLVSSFESLFSSGMVITSYKLETATPILTYGPSLSPTEPDAMAKFTMEISSPTASALDSWVRKLPDIVGVADSSVSRLALEDDGGGYTASVSVFISTDALLHRFDGVETATTEEEAPAPAATPTPTATPTPEQSDDINPEEDGS